MTMKWMKLFDSDEISKVMMDGEDNEERMDDNPNKKVLSIGGLVHPSHKKERLPTSPLISAFLSASQI